MLFNPFTHREIHLRGLVSTRRATEAVHVMQTCRADVVSAAPQWRVIERVTAGQVLLAAGDRDGASEAPRTALTAAEAHRLPHQIQRTIRAAQDGGLAGIGTEGQAALLRATAQGIDWAQ